MLCTRFVTDQVLRASIKTPEIMKGKNYAAVGDEE
jgi:hypothetical protein